MKTIRQTIISDDDVRGLVKSLQEMPERIRIAQDLLADAKTELDMFKADESEQEAIKTFEDEEMYEIINETNGDGKKKYTNEEQRKSAMRIRLAKNPEYVQAVQRLMEAKRRKAELLNHQAKLNNQVGALVGQSFVLRAVAEIIAGLSKEDNTAHQYQQIVNARADIDRAKQTLDGLAGVKEQKS
jgi:hypothetical protein